MAKACFTVSRNHDNPKDIEISIRPGILPGDISKEERELFVEIESTNTVIQSLKIKDEIQRQQYFEKLLSLAQAGLVGTNEEPQVGLAQKSLEELKKEIVTNEGARIKNNYMMNLGFGALIILIIPVLVLGSLNSLEKESFFELAPYLYCFIGSLAGTWISFGARKVELNFKDLNIIEKDRVNPYLRLIFVGISSMIFLLFLNSGIFELTIGSFSTIDIKSSIELQVLIGVLSGLVEYKLAIGLFDKATSIISFK